MLGIVFTSLVEMLEEQISPEFADEVLVAAELDSNGAYTAVGYYPYSEMERLLQVLSDKTGASHNDLLHRFGSYLFGRLATNHPQIMRQKTSVLDTLEALDDDIHIQVRQLYPDADLPAFTVLARTSNTMQLRYYSVRGLFALAEGLMDGAARYFGNHLERTTIPTADPATYEFHLTVTRL